jgi:hypothetical protein
VSFRLAFPVQQSAWQKVEPIRVAILNCLSAVLGDRELGEAVGIVTSELLENAIKYGDWSRDEGRSLTVTVLGMGREVDVEVASPVGVESAHLARLQELLAWIRHFPSTREAYIARMRAIADEANPRGESRMGLVRIAYEGPCAIEANEDAGLLTVRATIRAGRGDS